MSSKPETTPEDDIGVPISTPVEHDRLRLALDADPGPTWDEIDELDRHVFAPEPECDADE